MPNDYRELNYSSSELSLFVGHCHGNAHVRGDRMSGCVRDDGRNWFDRTLGLPVVLLIRERSLDGMRNSA